MFSYCQHLETFHHDFEFSDCFSLAPCESAAIGELSSKCFEVKTFHRGGVNKPFSVIFFLNY